MRQELIEKAARAMRERQIMLDYRGENRPHAIANEIATAALDAFIDALGEPDEEMVEAFWNCHAAAKTVFAEPADLFRAMLNTLKDPALMLAEVRR